MILAYPKTLRDKTHFRPSFQQCGPAGQCYRHLASGFLYTFNLGVCAVFCCVLIRLSERMSLVGGLHIHFKFTRSPVARVKISDSHFPFFCCSFSASGCALPLPLPVIPVSHHIRPDGLYMSILP